MSNTWGETASLTIFGESHGPCIGAVLDGIPAGVSLDWQAVSQEMRRRAPGRNELSTKRREHDVFSVESGFFNGFTTGTPLCVRIANEDQRAEDYARLRHIMRPGHADYSGNVRYGGYNDYRGGGHFSGRLTAPLVFAGAVAKQILALDRIAIGAHILQLGNICDRRFCSLGKDKALFGRLSQNALAVLDPTKEEEMEKAILQAKRDGDSVGGIVECMITGLPAGMGDPFFDSVESKLSHMIFAIPAVKGVSFGDGFALAAMTGSEGNDSFYYDDDGRVRTRTNHNGGINGGITNGMPVLFQAVIKGTPSIAKEQDTIDRSSGTNCKLSVPGRHDPAIVQRALPAVEAAAAWTVLDIMLTAKSGRPYDGK
ncbi:chorismate synthase [Megasphaera vaginalis (ex Bordigoni et al. 2020)]|uniref:chorismate synthase n=1 Tax=Megasphaera vaginalis (ex Bordigoni et al. 2020) TaxID=2045301 RepID=UPI000C7E2E7D|nr:chorismate synthase [Megasphaera vaginalis (ex Bordigoni et al. 2020)]